MEIPVKINVETATYDELKSAEKTLRELQTATLERYETIISEYVDTQSCSSICLYKIDWRAVTLRAVETSNSRSERHDIKLEYDYIDWYDRDNENIHICPMSSISEYMLYGNIEEDDEKERMNTISTLEVYLLIISKGDFFKGIVSYMKAMKRDMLDINDVFKPISTRISLIDSKNADQKKNEAAKSDFMTAVSTTVDAPNMYVVIEPEPDGYLTYKNGRYKIDRIYNYEYDNKARTNFSLKYRKLVVNKPSRCVLVKSLSWYEDGKPV